MHTFRAKPDIMTDNGTEAPRSGRVFNNKMVLIGLGIIVFTGIMLLVNPKLHKEVDLMDQNQHPYFKTKEDAKVTPSDTDSVAREAREGGN